MRMQREWQGVMQRETTSNVLHDWLSTHSFLPHIPTRTHLPSHTTHPSLRHTANRGNTLQHTHIHYTYLRATPTQHPNTKTGKEIRAQALVEPRNGFVMCHVTARTSGGVGAERMRGGVVVGAVTTKWSQQHHRTIDGRTLLHELATTLFQEDETISSWFASIFGIRSVCPSDLRARESETQGTRDSPMRPSGNMLGLLAMSGVRPCDSPIRPSGNVRHGKTAEFTGGGGERGKGEGAEVNGDEAFASATASAHPAVSS